MIRVCDRLLPWLLSFLDDGSSNIGMDMFVLDLECGDSRVAVHTSMKLHTMIMSWSFVTGYEGLKGEDSMSMGKMLHSILLSICPRHN